MSKTLFHRGRYLLFGLIALLTAMASSLLSPIAAHADGTGGTNTGGGSCNYSNIDVGLVWKLGDVPITNPGGIYCANGGSASWNLNARTRECYSHRNKMLNVFYLMNTGNRQWMQYPGAGNSRTTANYWKSSIDWYYNHSNINTKNNKYSAEKIRDEAKRIATSRGRNIIVICIWEEDTLLNQKCPTLKKDAAVSNVRRWVRPARSGKVIPAAQNTNAKRGAWCFSRSETETVTRNFVTQGTTPGKVYDYNWRCSIADGTPTHHAGPTPFTAQASDPVFTPLGELLNAAAANNTTPTTAQADAADAKKNSVDRCGVTLSESNKRWLAEGDVMNIQEFTQRASLDDDWVKTQPQRCTHSRSYKFSLTTSGTGSMSPNAWSPACDRSAGKNASGWTNRGSPTTVHHYYIASQTPELTGLWQSLTNHANSGDYGVGFKDALASKNALKTPVEDVANGDADKKWSGSAVTRKIDAPGNVSPAVYLVWGQGARDAKGTDAAGFYDKEAAYNGVRIPNDDALGLQTQARDNTFRNFTVEVYKPQAEGVVHDDAGQAITTTVSRWELGTPLPGNVSSKGTFFMKGSNDEQFFGPTRKEAATQRNWNTTIDNTYTWGQVRGEVSSFLTAATWTSEAAKPQVFSIKWEYAPTVDNTIPTVVGFGRAGARTYDTSVVGVRVQGKVQGRSDGSATSPALFKEQELNTGSGTKNTLDGLLYWGTDLDSNNKWVSQPDKFSPYYVALRFVRFTSQ